MMSESSTIPYKYGKRDGRKIAKTGDPKNLTKGGICVDGLAKRIDRATSGGAWSRARVSKGVAWSHLHTQTPDLRSRVQSPPQLEIPSLTPRVEITRLDITIQYCVPQTIQYKTIRTNQYC